MGVMTSTSILRRIEAPSVVTERRAVVRVLQHWRMAARSRPLPSRNDIDPVAIAADWRNCFLIDLFGHGGASFTYVGPALRIPAWGEAVGCRVTDCPPGTILFVASNYIDKVVESRLPVTHSGAAMHAGFPVLFRSILLPLSDNGTHVTALLGSANYRRVDHNRLQIIDED
jgi:hypothetical protein